MNAEYSGRPIAVEGHQYYSEGFLVEIGGLSEHGWFLVEYKDGRTHKYDMQTYHFNFTDKKS